MSTSMQKLRTGSATQRWVPRASVLALLLAISLAGCGPSPTPTATPTQPPAATPEPTPAPSPPLRPVMDPAGETAVEAGKKMAIHASAAGADWYKWELQGDGQISASTGPAILYTAPEEGGGMAVLTVSAHNNQGASPQTSLIITVPLTATVRLDALAVPLGRMSGVGEPDSFIELKASPNDCHTGSDCLRFTYKPGGRWGCVYWGPFCIGTIVHVRCQEAGEGIIVYGELLCIAFVRTQTWDRVQRGTCSINVLESGGLRAVNRLTFWARGERGGEVVEFRVGAVDVLPSPGRSLGKVTLTSTWEQYEIDLANVDLTNAIGLFAWIATDMHNPQGAVFYLDDIQFEGEKQITESPKDFPDKPEANVEATQLPQSAEQHLASLLTRLCWIAYSPTHFDPTTTPIQWPSEENVREDLRVLRDAGFSGLLTYGSNYKSGDTPGQMLDIPRLAQEAGFEGMIVGVWDPADKNELRAAEQASHCPVVVGYSVGNEGLDVRYDLETLVSVMERLRRITGKPVSTTEEVHDYYEDSPLWTISDWIFPNAHPYFAGYRDPQGAVEWTVKIFETLDSVSNKPLIFKEVGLPSGGDFDLNESCQAQYYRLLQETNVSYVVFEAFDAPWKHLGRPQPDGTYRWPDPEPHWGIFASDRTPKEAAADICPAR